MEKHIKMTDASTIRERRKTMHQLKPIAYDRNKITCVSPQVIEWHHGKHQKGYVDKRNEIEQKLSTVDRSPANANYSEYGELKRRESFNASGVILHEIYWETLGGNGTADKNLAVVKAIEQSFGSFEKWKEDFVACGKTSLGWAILCFDPSDGKLHNYLCDFHNHGAVWGAVPLLALDVFEHAYYKDNGPDRAAYIEKYMANLNWSAISRRFETMVPRGAKG
jgi:Fe-Mn family superoxide dismutase